MRSARAAARLTGFPDKFIFRFFGPASVEHAEAEVFNVIP